MPDIVEFIVAKTGPLSKAEETALLTLRRIFQKYPFGRNYIGTCFIEATSQAECCSLLKSRLEHRDYQLLEKSMYHFKARLALLWSHDRLRAKRFAICFRKLLESYQFAKMEQSVEHLFGKITRQLNVVVLALPELVEQICGSANTPGDFFTLEVNEHSNKDAAMRVLLHELTHMLVRRAGFCFQPDRASLNAIRTHMPQFSSMTGPESLEEVFLQFFLPDGFLARADGEQGISHDPSFNALPKEVHLLMKDVVDSNAPIQARTIRQFVRSIGKKSAFPPL